MRKQIQNIGQKNWQEKNICATHESQKGIVRLLHYILGCGQDSTGFCRFLLLSVYLTSPRQYKSHSLLGK
jgi:hypothetical protein